MKIGSLGILSLHMPTTNSNPGRRKDGGNIMYHSVPLPSGFTKKTLPIQMTSEASKMKLSEGCVYVWLLHILIGETTLQTSCECTSLRKCRNLGSHLDKVGARNSLTAENQWQDRPWPRRPRGRRRKLAEVMERREKIEKKLGIFEYRQASPQVHFAVLAVWVSLAANKLKKAAAGPAAERVFWVGCPAHVGARGAAAARSLNQAPAAGAPGSS